MKILILNSDIGYGGAEKNMAFVANELAKKGHEITFLTYRINNCLQELHPAVIHKHIQLETKGGNPFSMVRSILKLRGYIKKEKFDVALAFLSPSQFRLVLACKGLETKSVVSQRGDPYVPATGGKAKVSKKINEVVFELADAFVFQTEGARNYYPAKVQSKGVIIANPIKPLVRTKEKTEEEYRIVTVSRLDIIQKRQDLLIDAFNKFQHQYPQYTLELYGDGQDEDVIRKLASKNKNIKLMGKTSEVAAAIQTASMFVLTSDFEGIPNALLEAMSIGLPCISTKCSPGGAELLIEHEKNGLLVDCGNAEQLVAAMKRIADDKKFANCLAENAMQVNTIYSVDCIADLWDQTLVGAK
ncbi:MAG TPA: glycosyltransferase [Candidatus Scybalocola faecipullorum]|nr:glycosyltransferase [Candidatus Scybalocola faecipullorum]